MGWHYRVPGERGDCPACGAEEVEHLHPLPLHDRAEWQRVGFVSGCRRCGIVFSNPMPPAEVLTQMYAPDGRWGRTRQDEAVEQRPSGDYLVRLFAPLQPELDITRPSSGDAVLDFGCGSGEILDALQGLGWTTCGIEPAVKSAFTRHRELQAIPEPPTFKLAIAHHVLEHLPSPLEVLRALCACLNEGGFLFVSVPRVDTLPQHRDFRYCVNDRAHVVGYTRDAMATLMGMAGFQAIDLNPPPGQSDNRRALRRLRMIGRKSGVRMECAEPLQAARRVFQEWRRSNQEVGAPRSVSVRAAAAIQNVERLRRPARPPG